MAYIYEETTTEDIQEVEQVATKGKVVVPCRTLNRLVTRLLGEFAAGSVCNELQLNRSSV
jgi:hypothetical protein